MTEEEVPGSQRRPVAAADDPPDAETVALRPVRRARSAPKQKGRNPKYREPGDPAPGWVKRLKQAIDRSGLSLREISRRVALETDGLRVGEGLIAQWISGRSRRPEFQKVLATFFALPEANAWWIMTGVGEIDAPNPRPLPKDLVRLFESDKKLSATVRRAMTVFLAKHPQELSDEDLESIAREFVSAESRAKKIVEAAVKVRALRELEQALAERRQQRLEPSARTTERGDPNKSPLAKVRKD